MGAGYILEVGHDESQSFSISHNQGSQVTIEVDRGKVSAEIQQDGIRIEHKIVDAGVSKPFDFTNFSDAHKFTLVVTGIALTENSFRVLGI